MIDTATRRGRGQPSRQTEVENWLLNLLSGGSRQTNEILQAGELRGHGYSARSIHRARKTLELVAFQKNRAWYWRDPSIPEADDEKRADETFQETLLKRLDSIERKTQVPRAITEDGLAPEVKGEVDGLGYSKDNPTGVNITVKVVDVIARVKQMLNAGEHHDDITRAVLTYACPASGLSESTIVALLKSNSVTVPPKSKLFPAAAEPNF
jgi:hypothetical protein